MSDWYLIVDPEDAPESCGSFYWDPLLSTVPGNNLDAFIGNNFENSPGSKLSDALNSVD